MLVPVTRLLHQLCANVRLLRSYKSSLNEFPFNSLEKSSYLRFAEHSSATEYHNKLCLFTNTPSTPPAARDAISMFFAFSSHHSHLCEF